MDNEYELPIETSDLSAIEKEYRPSEPYQIGMVSVAYDSLLDLGYYRSLLDMMVTNMDSLINVVYGMPSLYYGLCRSFSIRHVYLCDWLEQLSHPTPTSKVFPFGKHIFGSFLANAHGEHDKLARIKFILDDSAPLRYLLIDSNTSTDLQVYQELLNDQQYSGRILGIFIRNVRESDISNWSLYTIMGNRHFNPHTRPSVNGWDNYAELLISILLKLRQAGISPVYEDGTITRFYDNLPDFTGEGVDQKVLYNRIFWTLNLHPYSNRLL